MRTITQLHRHITGRPRDFYSLSDENILSITEGPIEGIPIHHQPTYTIHFKSGKAMELVGGIFEIHYDI